MIRGPPYVFKAQQAALEPHSPWFVRCESKRATESSEPILILANGKLIFVNQLQMRSMNDIEDKL